MEIEKLQFSDIASASELIEKSFYDSVASTLSDEGISNFSSGITESSIEKRLQSGNLFLVCKSSNEIVGVGEVRDKNHLNLLFVNPSFQRSGIGKQLLLSLIENIEEETVTVNSSLNSVEAYKSFGFIENGPRDEVRGIKYQSMVLKIEEKT